MQTLNTRRIAIVIGLIMGLGALVGTFLVLTKAESTSSNGESGSGDSKNIDRSTAANDPPLQTDTTDEAAVDLRTPDAFESSIPLAELFSALETACKMSDVEGIRMVLRTLFDRDIDEVAEASLRRLDGTSDKNSGLPEFSPPPQGLYRTYLLYLAGRAYPERLFSELRAWWSEPDMTLARRNEWTRINRKPTARLAKDALPPDDRWQARVSGSVLVDYAKEGQASGLAVYALLERLYGGELPQGGFRTHGCQKSWM